MLNYKKEFILTENNWNTPAISFGCRSEKEVQNRIHMLFVNGYLETDEAIYFEENTSGRGYRKMYIDYGKIASIGDRITIFTHVRDWGL